MTQQPAERVSWASVKADMKHPESDNNNGLVYGLYLYDNSMGLDKDGKEQWQDICDVQWFKTDEERDKYITENNLRIVFDE